MLASSKTIAENAKPTKLRVEISVIRGEYFFEFFSVNSVSSVANFLYWFFSTLFPRRIKAILFDLFKQYQIILKPRRFISHKP